MTRHARVAPGLHPQDEAAPVGAGGVRVGKFTRAQSKTDTPPLFRTALP